MKYQTVCFLLLILNFQSCLPVEDNSIVLSFWTDSFIDTDVEYALYINNEPVGQIPESYSSVLCDMDGLVNVNVLDANDMNLEIRNSRGDVVDIGMINLSAPSSGILVKTADDNEIFVKHDIDDPCTLVRLRWN